MSSLTDYPIIRYTEEGLPVYCVPIEMVKDNPNALRVPSEADAITMGIQLVDGQVNPIVVIDDGTIIDGHRRVGGLKWLRRRFVDVVVADVQDGLNALQALLNRTTTYGL